MKYWEKNKTRDMIGSYMYNEVAQGTYPSRFKAAEDFIFKHFCISHPYTGLLTLPNLTLGGFSI